MFFNAIIFILFIIFLLYLPTKLIFIALNTEKSEDLLIDFGLYSSLGIVIVTVMSFILGFLGISYFVSFICLLVLILYFIINKKLNLSKIRYGFSCLSSKHAIVLIIILIGVMTQNIVLFRGGWKVQSGYVFPSMHDTMWNISLSSELFHHFPPQHPGVSGIPLKNNHYFYPLFLAIVRSVSYIDNLDLYFRLGPILVSLLFGLSLYSVSTLFTKNYFFRSLCVFLGYFSGSFAYLTPFFMGSKFEWRGNTFFSDQPFDQLINPYSVLGFTFILFSIFVFSKIFKEKNPNNFNWMLMTALFIGSLYGFKSFGGIIVLLALFMSVLFHIIIYKNLKVLKVLFFTLVVFIPIFVLTTDIGKTHLYWAPGWLLSQLVSSQDKLYLPNLVNIEAHYLAIGNTLGILKIKTIEFLIYSLGNSGIRIFGLLYLIIYITKKQMNSLHLTAKLFLFFCFLIAFMIPLLFNLGSNAYNIVQFTPYSLVILAIFTALLSERVYYHALAKNKSYLGVVFIFFIILLSIPVNVKNIIGKIALPKEIVSFEEMSALSNLKEKSDKDDIILINPQEYDIDPMYISALSERRIFLASPGYARQTLVEVGSRSESILHFFNTVESSDFLNKNKITRIYLLKKNNFDSLKKKFEEINTNIIFENDKVGIFKNNNI